jgi:hypothetical protein
MREAASFSELCNVPGNRRDRHHPARRFPPGARSSLWSHATSAAQPVPISNQMNGLGCQNASNRYISKSGNGRQPARRFCVARSSLDCRVTFASQLELSDKFGLNNLNAMRYSSTIYGIKPFNKSIYRITIRILLFSWTRNGSYNFETDVHTNGAKKISILFILFYSTSRR